MAFKTPPTEHLDFASAAESVVNTGLAKQQTGYLASEAPGAGELNYIYKTAGAWNKLVSQSLAGRMAMNNVDYTTSQPVWYQGASLHIEYLPLADMWYGVSVNGTSGNVYIFDSADGVTWSGAKLVGIEAAASGGNTTKVVTNGTIIAIAIDNTCYYSTGLTVATLTLSSTFASIDEVSDMGYLTSGVWVAAGRDNGTVKGRIERAVSIASWSNEYLALTDANYVYLATDGFNVCAGTTGTNDDVVDTTGTATNFVPCTVDPPQAMSHAAYSTSLGAFVGLGAATNFLYTSKTGATWVDHNAVGGLPALHQIAHTPDFFIAWGIEASGKSTVYIFPNTLSPEDGITYEVYGEAYGNAIPADADNTCVLQGGQGKLLFTYNPSSHYLAIARYGAS